MSSAWRRSVRRRAPVSEREEGRRELGRRVEELEEAVEGLRGEKNAAEAEEAALCAELNAERGAAESAARETMSMIERLQREKAAALLEARQFRRLAEGRVERDRQLHNELASLSALAGGYLALLHAHGIGPADENCYHDHEEERPVEVEHVEPKVDRESTGESVVVVKKSVPPPPAEELECTKDMGCAAASKSVAVECTEEERVDGAPDLYARVGALEADRAATRREVAALRAEPARAVLARDMARRLCRESAAVTTVQKPRFSVLAICKWFFPMILRSKRCFTARSAQVALLTKNVLLSFSRSFHKTQKTFPESLTLTLGFSSALLGMLLLLERFTAALHRRRRRSLLGS
ncbi:hypothetical protein CFC21_072143 [Triticum aestivum]|uniref:GTD-binding domain-containing protein n=2 Tax=Triticum aestivum TaxID=4565 RepID=A0A3B6LNU3_WHEAT|nr:uncharacterized protein LOC119310745 [Triticum dicoccoides]XP_044393278.1 uncharacterized protein LOC123116379 [Triticum aestivum]KAF7066102.1 hypothetical protein CFC21_072143 [Triticum aestivum]